MEIYHVVIRQYHRSRGSERRCNVDVTFPLGVRWLDSLDSLSSVHRTWNLQWPPDLGPLGHQEDGCLVSERLLTILSVSESSVGSSQDC